MSFKVQKITRPDGQHYIRMELVMPAPAPAVIADDGTVLLRQYLTAEQWEKFKRIDTEELEFEISP